MSRVQLVSVLRRAGMLALALALAAGLLRAQSAKFDQARTALINAAQAEQKKQGLDKNKSKLFSQYPCPEVALTKAQAVAPGGAISVSLNGKFPAGTTFLSDNDGAVLSGNLTGSTYTGRVTIAPNQLPGFVHIYAFTPVSAGYAVAPVAFISSAYSFELHGENGWVIKATPASATWTVSDGNAELHYNLEFFRPGEAKPFETMTGRMSYSSSESPSKSMNMNLEEAPSGAQAELQAIGKKLSDPQAFAKLSPAEQSALIQKMTTLQQQSMKEMMANVSDPAAMQKKQDDFGCQSLSLKVGQPGAVVGSVQCGKNVNHGSLPLTGSMTPSK